MWMWIVQFFSSSLHQSAFYIFLRGEKYVTYEKVFYKIEASAWTYTLKSNNQQRREIFIFAKIKFYVMRRVNIVGSVRGFWLQLFSSVSFLGSTFDVILQTNAALLRKAFSLLKKQGRSIYIDDDDREIIWKKPLSQCPSPLICHWHLFSSLLYPCFVSATKRGWTLFRALDRWFFKNFVGLRLHKCLFRSFCYSDSGDWLLFSTKLFSVVRGFLHQCYWLVISLRLWSWSHFKTSIAHLETNIFHYRSSLSVLKLFQRSDNRAR